MGHILTSVILGLIPIFVYYFVEKLLSEMSGEQPKLTLLQQAALQIVAGGSAGFVEVCIMHPLDLVKTRLQLQSKKTVGATVAGNQVKILSLL